MKIMVFDKVEDLGDDFIERCMSFLPAWRCEQMLKYKYNRGRIESAVSYLMLLGLLQRQLGNFQKDLAFTYNEHGKPFLTKQPDLFFSISHCKSAVAVALSNTEIGVDIEETSRFRDSLVRYVCNDDEIREIEDSKDKSLAFIKLWTRKEAVFKFLGIGITHDIKDILSNKDVQTHTVELDGKILTVASKMLKNENFDMIFIGKDELLSIMDNEDCKR
ncbi:MAG: 4'-phosphopantetheinyl transferase family protein [Candidatus Limimorpha sp.]